MYSKSSKLPVILGLLILISCNKGSVINTEKIGLPVAVTTTNSQVTGSLQLSVQMVDEISVSLKKDGGMDESSSAILKTGGLAGIGLPTSRQSR